MSDINTIYKEIFHNKLKPRYYLAIVKDFFWFHPGFSFNSNWYMFLYNEQLSEDVPQYIRVTHKPEDHDSTEG